MYSGSDSTGSQNINQWPLNPAAYQNTPNEHIDWAALAQQWIIMKEAGPPVPDQITTTAPPPNNQKIKNDVSEGGEAPMEVENDKDDDNQPPQWNNDPPVREESWNWNQQWGWGNQWSAPPGIPPPSKAPLLPTPVPFNQFSGSSDNATSFPGYNRSSSTEFSGGYWTAAGSKLKSHNKRYSKVNVPAPRAPVSPVPDPVTLDANKRKQLPGWIREGLEKMERDKQRQIEKEREQQEKVEVVEKSKLDEKEALEIIKMTVKEREKSKFDSEAEDSDGEFNHKEKRAVLPDPVILTQEELMLKLRRTMTEILLKVTNQEIRAVCKEEFQRHLRKNKASNQRVSASSGTNNTGKLGLGIYGDSGSSSEDDHDSDQDQNDSDSDLKDAIRRRKAEFSKTEREIEDRLAAAEKNRNDDSRGGTPAVDDCDSQVDAKSQGNKVKSHDGETSIRSASKRNKRKASSSSSNKSDSDHRKEKKRLRSKRSSSSESDYYSKKSKSRYKKNKSTRSPTPERTRTKEKSRDRKSKPSESNSSKSTRSQKSRSRSVDSIKKRRSSVTDKQRKDRTSSKTYSKHSHSRSSSKSTSSRSRKSEKHHKSRSRTRSIDTASSKKSTRSRKSPSNERRRSKSSSRAKRSRSRPRSKSLSPTSRLRHRSRSHSNNKSKKSRKH